jgi:hypothetical protein
MRRIVGAILCSMVGSLLLSSVAFAVRPGEPKKANKVQLTLARNWADQGAANDTTTGSLTLPAHHPAATTDACAFDPVAGGGKLSASVTGTPDIKFAIKLAGVTGCEGQNLCLAATIKLTTQGCTSMDPMGCTAGPTSFDAILSAANLCCTVTGGKCALATSANAAFGAGVITASQQINAQILDSGVTHGANRAFSSALYVP